MHSSTSIAIRLRNSIVVGFIKISPSEIVGNSSGKPPALQTPRLTASATWRRWALQVLSSDHEFAIPTTGRPSKTRSLKPSARRYARFMSPSRVRRPNQLRLRSVVMWNLPGMMIYFRALREHAQRGRTRRGDVRHAEHAVGVGAEGPPRAPRLDPQGQRRRPAHGRARRGPGRGAGA